MNLGLLTAFIDRLSIRTKLIGVAVVALLIGMWLGGRGGNEGTGRYVPFTSGNSMATLDTRTGQVWVVDHDSQTYHKGPRIPYW